MRLVKDDGPVDLNYDYGNVSEQDKKVVGEVISHLRNRNNIPTEMVVEELKQKFNISELPVKDIDQTLWHKLTWKHRDILRPTVQGHKLKTLENGTKLKLPIVMFSADLDQLDEILIDIIEQAKKLNVNS
jgi:hypothetical protein